MNGYGADYAYSNENENNEDWEKNPIIGVQIREERSSVLRTVGLYTIKGFTYKKGNEYELLVKKTTLANPPQDSGNVRYELISIVSQRKISLKRTSKLSLSQCSPQSSR